MNIQNGALEYIKQNRTKIDIDNNSCLRNLFRVMLKPNCMEAELLGNIEFVDDKCKYIAKPKKMLEYIPNIKLFIIDFKESNWRIGFLKRLLKVVLPYYFINNLIRKIFLKKEKK